MTGNGFYIPPIKMVIFLGDGVFMALGITHILQLFFILSGWLSLQFWKHMEFLCKLSAKIENYL